MNPAAWHPDPTGRHELRYWDGSSWTDHVADNGEVGNDPLHGPAATVEPGEGEAESAPVESAPVETDVAASDDAASDAASSDADPTGDEPAPFDGMTQVAHPAAAQPAEQPAERPVEEPVRSAQPPSYIPQQAAPPQQPPQQQAPQHAPQPGAAVPAAAFGGITGDLIDGRYAEVGGEGAVLQNRRLLRVRITEPFMAKQGSMVSYQGDVNFAYQGSGAAKFLKKAFTSEGLSVMRVEGRGDVFLADNAKHVHILRLTNAGLSINGDSVLAFSASLEWNVERVKGGSMAAGGLFNTTLRGTGWVAITTDGEPVVLNAADAPTFADAHALVAWSTSLQTSIRSTFTAGSLIGRGSGEAFQVAFNGQGFVIVQPAEGGVVAPHTH